VKSRPKSLKTISQSCLLGERKRKKEIKKKKKRIFEKNFPLASYRGRDGKQKKPYEYNI